MFKTALLAACAFAGSVQVLTDENFTQKVFEDPHSEAEAGWFVKFFAPWCPHCKKIAPIWEEFSIKYSDMVNVAEVNCSIYEDLCAEYNVRSWPMLLFFPAENPNNIQKFHGDRKVNQFVKFVEQHSDNRANV